MENTSPDLVDYIDQKNTYTKGYLAQQHNDGSVVHFRNLLVRSFKP